MRIFADYHTHSDYSDGRGTVEEMVDAARRKGLRAIAITDHGPDNIGVGVETPDTYLAVKKEIERLQGIYGDIDILVGAEADIIGMRGEIDVPRRIYQELDLLLVGLHPYVRPVDVRSGWRLLVKNQTCTWSSGIRRSVVNDNTKCLMEALYRHDVDILVHPGLKMPVDISEISRACVKTETLFEINTGHFYLDIGDIHQAAKEGVRFVVNSDAHFPETVGKVEEGLDLLKRAKVPREQVANVYQ
ncbi:PHP domain-containing protein [Calderihabitans maritimus]|uniref:PHP domain-containing protein n=1 Tax=Calderihabitans maritimus TaxID=1246530 RepID=A0A1Z5HUH0_9FIRM|nr:PHP domain-containing protein [Calderihabitans maritimus]GAW93183.1 PHP domain-containing protein [Calderihabitans maritimus]